MSSRSFLLFGLIAAAAVAAGLALAIIFATAPEPEPVLAEAEAPVPVPLPGSPDASPADPAPEPVIALPDTAPDAPPPAPMRDPRAAQLLVPVEGVDEADLREDWGDPRSGGRTHQGLDIMAPRGTPVLAADAGEIRKFFDSDAGGTTIYQADSSGRYILYYAHLDRRAPNLSEGDRVLAGQVIGYVGSTGNAPDDAPHLHFEVNIAPEDGSWYGGDPLNPYSLLLSVD